jgi:UDP-N-acetyl-D-glucosamine dehydrogenase
VSLPRSSVACPGHDLGHVPGAALAPHAIAARGADAARERKAARGVTDVAIVGAGYVGLPLAQVFADAGRSVVLVDVSQERVDRILRGESYIEDVPSETLRRLVSNGLSASTDYDVLREADAILIALPTPLSKQREPDLSIVLGATEQIAPRLRKGHLVVLESTTYPGTTREQLQPILERSGLTAGEDFHLAFSPERVDPGRTDWTTKNVPKVVGGLTPACTERAAELYRSAIDTVHSVSSPEAAELTKLLENIFRSVNIALVNELAQLCDRMGIDVWEVVGAAASKPFGFMSFQPGPGLGGHCIPIDPFYLTWKAREFDFYTEFIELAGKVNENMPYYCRSLISQALNHGARKSLSGSKVLILGVAYKADIGDMRESPALKILQLIQNAGADVSYHDPHVPELPEFGLRSVPLEPDAYDCVVIVTAHSTIDYEDLVDRAHVVVDFRNATGKRGRESEKVWKL